MKRQYCFCTAVLLNIFTFMGSTLSWSTELEAGKEQFNDKLRNISFYYPKGWKMGMPGFTRVAAIVSNGEGHSITVLDSGNSAYSCDNYTSEMQTTQGVLGIGKISVKGRPMSWLKHTAYNKDAGIKMTSVHYCVNTTNGAVIIIGAAPEDEFSRSKTTFKSIVDSLVVRK
jgi:hypothetical protein